MNPSDVLIEAGRLGAAGRPYALATVVNVVRPASTKRGDKALVAPDGALTGWIGGACSEPTVVREALAALADGETRLVKIEGGCASEGTVEVLIEPQLPASLLAVIGESPAAHTLVELARAVGWRIATEDPGRADAVVVATMGRGDEDALAAALSGSAGYVGLVASARRAATVLDDLRGRGLDEEALTRVRSPAGLDLGPLRQEEIAVAVLAELVAWRHARTPLAPPEEAVDPVCGMTVVLEGAETVVHEGATYVFCGPRCRASFEAEPARYLVVETG